MVVSREKAELQADLPTFLMEHIFFFFQLEKQNTDRKLVIQTWVFGRHFLEYEQSETVTSRKTADYICGQG